MLSWYMCFSKPWSTNVLVLTLYVTLRPARWRWKAKYYRKL